MAMDGGAHIDEKDIPELVSDVRRSFATGRTRPIEWRKRQLQGIKAMFEERESVMLEALRADLGKHAFEATLAETAGVAADVRHTIAHLDKWMRPTKVKTSLVNQPGSSRIYYEPLGVALIIAPWNYPIQLVMSPLIGAVAAGNCAVLKPSELTPHSAEVIAEWVPRYLDPDCVKVVLGGVPETTALLEEKWDHVFFTGSTAVGRVVMSAAAKHLTPVTLELGGKSPCIIDRDVDIEVAAKRIAWGKFFNCGQTCIAPDYLLIDRTIEDVFLHRLQAAIREFYGDDPQKSDSYPRIVNARHHARLSALLGEGELVCGGQTDEANRYIAPTVIRRIEGHEKVMEEEIFGPILPVIAVGNLDEAIDFVNKRPKPLALYIFTKNKDKAERVVMGTTAGGMCVNDVLAHFGALDLPFGGVGPSGMGAYHGHFSFETFSHKKAVLDKSTMIDPSLRYPPYDDAKRKWIKRAL